MARYRYDEKVKRQILAEVAKLTGGVFTEKTLNQPKVFKIFETITGKKTNPRALWNMIDKMRFPEKYQKYRENMKNGVGSKKKKKEDRFKVFNSNFVLVIDGVGLYGFDDETSLKASIEKMDTVAMIGRNVHLFSKRKVKVECKII